MFIRPTLTQIRDRVENDFKSGLNLTTVLMRSFVKVMGAGLSGASHTIHGHLQDYVQKQFFTDTMEEFYLLRDGKIFGVDRIEATFTELEIEISGTPGSVIPGTDSSPTAAAIYQRIDGVEYQVKNEVMVGVGGTVIATLVALLAGSASNIDDASELSLSSPIAGVTTTAVVQSTVIEGGDQEPIENYRVRILERKRRPPAGGTVADYIAFAKTVAGVTRVWVLPGYLGQGTVAVTFVEDGEDPIIPSGPKVQEVRDAIFVRMPVEVQLTVFAPIAAPINPTIKLKPNTLAIRNAVIAELDDLIFREAQVRSAVDPDQVAAGVQFTGKIPLSKINEAISIATGEDDHELVIPTETPQPSEGGIVTLGTVTFQTLL